ncbi:MAG: ABC transporter permease [Burkholderiales bacterium]
MISRRTLRQIAAILIFFALWQGAVWLIYGNSTEGRLLPAPLDVLAAARELLASGELVRHTERSLLRVLVGLFIATGLAVPLGLLIGWFPLARDMGEIIIDTFRPIPPLAWIPLAVLWFGLTPASAVFIIVIGGFFPTLVSTVAGVRGVDRGLLEAAHTLGANASLDLFRRVVLPAALPSILTGIRISASLAWMSVVAAEMIAIDSGLGYMILNARQLFRPDIVVVGMAMIGVIGFAMDRLLYLCETTFLRWRRVGRTEAGES